MSLRVSPPLLDGRESLRRRLLDTPDPLHGRLWLLAVFLFGVGDLVTTSVGLASSGVSEIGPIAGPLIEQYGPGAMVALKIGAFAGFYAIWRLVPRPHSLGVPLGLAFLGGVVTLWNLLVITLATVA